MSESMPTSFCSFVHWIPQLRGLFCSECRLLICKEPIIDGGQSSNASISVWNHLRISKLNHLAVENLSKELIESEINQLIGNTHLDYLRYDALQKPTASNVAQIIGLPILKGYNCNCDCNFITVSFKSLKKHLSSKHKGLLDQREEFYECKLQKIFDSKYIKVIQTHCDVDDRQQEQQEEEVEMEEEEEGDTGNSI
jgi:hypothetical protein